MADLVNQLQSLKKRQSQAQDQKARLEGRRDQLLQQLEKDYGCSSVDEAKERLSRMQADIARREERLQKTITSIKEAIGE